MVIVPVSKIIIAIVVVVISSVVVVIVVVSAAALMTLRVLSPVLILPAGVAVGASSAA